MPLEERQLQRLRHELEIHMGSEALCAFRDPRTIELMLNADGRLWVEKLGGSPEPVCSLTKQSAEAICQLVSSALDKTIDKDRPIVEGEFPLDGSRFEGLLPPLVSAASFSIRKKASLIFRLEDYVKSGTMTEAQRRVIEEGIESHANILIVGGTGSGKTTLVNACIAHMVEKFPHERIVIIEDTGEIQCSAENALQLHSTMTTSMTDLLKATLRLRPDRILVGEARGPEALDLLMAWNTGHPGGVATVHANSAEGGLERIRMLVSMNSFAPQDSEILIGEAVNYVIFIARDPALGRQVKEIIRVEGYDANSKRYRFKKL